MVGLKTARCAFEAQFTLLSRLKDLSEYCQPTEINTILHSQFYEQFEKQCAATSFETLSGMLTVKLLKLRSEVIDHISADSILDSEIDYKTLLKIKEDSLSQLY